MKRNLQEEIKRIKNLNEQLQPAVEIPKIAQKLLPNITQVVTLLSNVANQIVANIQKNPQSPTLFTDMKNIMANGFKQNPQVKQSFDKYIGIVFNKEGEIRGIFDAGINLFKKELGEYNAIPIEGIEVAKVALKEAYGDQTLQTYLNVFNKMTQKLGMNTTASMTQMDPSLGLPTSFTEEQLADYNKVTGQDSGASQTPSTETEPSQDGVVAEMRKKGKGVIIEGADYKGIYADTDSDDNVRFLKDGKVYVYSLYKLGKIMDIGVDVKNIKKEGEQILMDYSAYGQTGTEPLGKNKLDTIIPKIGQDKIEFLNAKQEEMYLKKQ
jgi:hypothetical protein